MSLELQPFQSLRHRHVHIEPRVDAHSPHKKAPGQFGQGEDFIAQIIAAVTQQLAKALGPDAGGGTPFNRNAAADDGVDAASGAKGAGKNAGPASLLEAFQDLLKLVNQLLGDASPSQANPQAQKLADALDGGDSQATTPALASAAPSPSPSPSSSPSPAPSSTSPSSAAPGGTGAASTAAPASGPAASSVDEAAARTHPKFMPVLRGDEAALDRQIHNQADFGKAADRTAKEYGLDPNMFRAQLEAESSAFRGGYQKALHAEGDLDRKPQDNTSVGLGQISKMFLDGRDWSKGSTDNARMGNQKVSLAQYQDSPTIQLRMAAGNIAQRIADAKADGVSDSVKAGLSSYVSGTRDFSNAHATQYISNINELMKNPAVIGPGR